MGVVAYLALKLQVGGINEHQLLDKGMRLPGLCHVTTIARISIPICISLRAAYRVQGLVYFVILISGTGQVRFEE